MKKFKTGDWAVVLDTPVIRGWSSGAKAIGEVICLKDTSSSSYYISIDNKYGINYCDTDLRPATLMEIPREALIGACVKFVPPARFPYCCPIGAYGKVVGKDSGNIDVRSKDSFDNIWHFPNGLGLEWHSPVYVEESETKAKEPEPKEPTPKLDLTNTKVWIGDNPKLSEEIQNVAFSLGWGWTSAGKIVQKTKFPSLYFYSDKSICYSTNDIEVGREFFAKNPMRELFVADFGIIISPSPIEIRKEEEKQNEQWWFLEGAGLEVVYALVIGNPEEGKTISKVYTNGVEERLASYVATSLLERPVDESVVQEFVKKAKTEKRMFLRDEYIVSNIDTPKSAPKNWCVKQRESLEYIAPYVDSVGDKLNRNDELLFRNSKDWRYATKEEIEIYDRFGPFDTKNPPAVKIKEESPKIEPKMSTKCNIKVGDTVTMLYSPSPTEWGKMTPAPDFLGSAVVSLVSTPYNDGVWYVRVDNGYNYPASCLMIVEDRTKSSSSPGSSPVPPTYPRTENPFSKGDIVIGRPSASSVGRYGITVEGWVGIVDSVEGSTDIRVSGYPDRKSGPHRVEARHFSHHIPAETEKTPTPKPVSPSYAYSVGQIVTLISNESRSCNKIGDIGVIKEAEKDSYSVVTARKHTAGNWSRGHEIRYAIGEEVDAYTQGFACLEDYKKAKSSPKKPSSPSHSNFVTHENIYEGMKVAKAPDWYWGRQGEGCDYGVVVRDITGSWVSVQWIFPNGAKGSLASYRIKGDILDLVVYEDSGFTPSGLISMADDIGMIPLKEETGGIRLLKID